MKPNEGLIRWKAVVPGLVTTALVAVFMVFFLDWTVEWAIEKAGTMANGARVELSGVNINFATGTVTLKGLQVTDHGAPMTNAVEIESMKLAVAVKPLFWSKVIVEKGEIKGVRTGTPRKYSGAVPKTATEKEAEEKEAKEKGKGGPGTDYAGKGKEALSDMTGNLKDQYDPRQLKAEDLASYRKTQEEAARINGVAAEWDSKADAIKSDGKMAEAKALLDRIKGTDYNGVAGIKKAAEDAKEAQKLKGELKQLSDAVSSAKTSLTSEVAKAKGAVKEIDALKKADVENAMGKLKGGAFSAEGLTRSALGPEYFGKLETALGWFEKIRGMMGSKAKKGEKPAPPPPRKGKDIPFKFKYSWPAFHLKVATVTGVTSGDNPIEYTGELKDVTSDPVLVGRPIVLNLKGGEGSRMLTLKAVLDYTKERARESVTFSYDGIALAGMKLGDVNGPVGIRDGKGRANGDIETSGDTINGTVVFNADPVGISHEGKQASGAQQKVYAVVHDVLVGLKKLNVVVGISGTIKKPGFSVKSSMDKAFGGAVSALMKKELDAQRAKAQARVNELVDGEKGKLTALVDAKSAGALSKLGGKAGSIDAVQGSIDKAIADLKTKGEGAVLKSVPTGGLKGFKRK
jgi:uncharacterized protein (TIGR03545 family)